MITTFQTYRLKGVNYKNKTIKRQTDGFRDMIYIKLKTLLLSKI